MKRILGFLEGKPCTMLLAMTAVFSVAVIAITMLAAIIASKAGVDDESVSAVSPSQASVQGVTEEMNQRQSTMEYLTNEQETATKEQITAAKETVAAEPQQLDADNFAELDIKGFELQKLKFLVTNSDMWHEGEIRDNNSLTFALARYIEKFAEDYNIKDSENWSSAPIIFDDYIKETGYEVKGALSIEEYNMILRDIYGDSVEEMSYSDFPEVLELNRVWRIWHTLGGEKDSAKCSECLLIVGPTGETDFVGGNVEYGRFAGFKVDGDMISAICVSVYEADEFMDEPYYVLELESRLAKGNNGYYLHSVNPNLYGGGDSPVYPATQLEDYEYYNDFSMRDEPENPIDCLPSVANAVEKIDSPEKAYEDYLDMRKHNDYAEDFADTENERYCYADINGDGVNEMIITGDITYDRGWQFTRIYTCDTDDYTVTPASELIYHYGEPRISEEYSALVIEPYRGTSITWSEEFVQYKNGEFRNSFTVSADRSETEDYTYSYHVSDSLKEEPVDDINVYLDTVEDLSMKHVADR